MRRLPCAILAIAMGLLGSGCKVGPDYWGPPAPTLTGSYPEAVPAEENVAVAIQPGPNLAEPNSGVVGECEGETDVPEPIPAGEWAPELADWWTALDAPVLNQLVASVAAQNLDLHVAAERVFEARARRGTVASSLFPQFDTDASFTHGKRPSGGTLGGSARNWWSWGTDLSWEIDVFGRLQRLLEAADADIGEKEELDHDTLILLIAETATAYVEARSHQEQMAIVAGNINIQRETVRLVRSRLNNEKADMLDVSQAEGSLKDVEAGAPSFQALYRQSINRLSVLTGKGITTSVKIVAKARPPTTTDPSPR